jgi:hypothetical protein
MDHKVVMDSIESTRNRIMSNVEGHGRHEREKNVSSTSSAAWIAVSGYTILYGGV